LKSIEENDKDATILLSMGKSYSQYERERLGLCYQSKSDAEKSMLKRNGQELDGKVKPKKHHGKYTNYCFDKDTFLDGPLSLLFEKYSQILFQKLG
jgi:hypothetical protein